MSDPPLAHLARSGTIEVLVTPRASRNEVVEQDGQVRVYTTMVPEAGKANAAVIRLLAKALGLPKSRLTLLCGDTARTKLFRIEPEERPAAAPIRPPRPKGAAGDA